MVVNDVLPIAMDICDGWGVRGEKSYKSKRMNYDIEEGRNSKMLVITARCQSRAGPGVLLEDTI